MAPERQALAAVAIAECTSSKLQRGADAKAQPRTRLQQMDWLIPQDLAADVFKVMLELVPSSWLEIQLLATSAKQATVKGRDANS
jgi:hypothetical protein